MQSQNRDIREKLEPFRRRWWVIASIVVAVSAVTYYHYKHRPARYVASTSIFVRAAGTTPGVGTDPETDPARRLSNEATLLQSPEVAADVANKLHYKGDPRDLISEITVTPSPNSDFVTITASTSNAVRSAAVANGFANAFATINATQARTVLAAQEANVQTQLAQLPRTLANESLRGNLEQQLQTLQLSQATPPGVQIVTPAKVPKHGSAASPTRNAIFGAVLGLVLACLLIRGLEAFDRRLRHPVVEDEYGLPLLASIPFSRKAHAGTRSGAQVPVAIMEGVRGLRTMLDHGAGSGDRPRTVLVTSAVSGEGKSTLIKSLALGYYESGRSVLVIDADLRRPMVHELFGAALVPGLSDVLRSAISLSDAVQEVHPGDLEPALTSTVVGSDPNVVIVPHNGMAQARALAVMPDGNGGAPRGPALHVLTSGSGTSDPAALLGSASFASVLAEAPASYDIVLIDSTPILSVSDAIPAATLVDSVVVVARSDYTTRDAAQRCRQMLERVPSVTVLGVVANGVRRDGDTHRRYYLAAAS